MQYKTGRMKEHVCQPWATRIIGGGSILLQIGKWLVPKFGQEVSTTLVHWGAGLLTALYLGLSGGFAGIPVPVVPTGGDFLAWLSFVGQVGGMIAAGAAGIAGIYDLALRKIYGGIELVYRTVFG
jgi:hypothetical protein